MASSRVIVYLLTVRYKAQRCYESQSRQLKTEGERNFPGALFAGTDQGVMQLCALPSAVPVPLQNYFLRACTLSL